MKRLLATLSDASMCAMMYVLQRRHRPPPRSRERIADYLARHEHLPRPAYFSTDGDSSFVIRHSSFAWPSPIASPFPENNHCHALAFPCERGWSAPTVLMLHALMSASDRGYREWARRFNERGWNAVFIHLPYHYSRTPRRHLNGELAITADIVRTAEGLRAGVVEIRQLIAWLRARGCTEFGLWACSYGGWIGALLASIEEFKWAALIEPIVDLSDALWRSPAAAAVRRHLREAAIDPALITRLHPLLAPAHGSPRCDRVLFAAGEYDHIARAEDIRRLHEQWPGSTMITEPQGHFGFRLMRSAWRWLESGGHLGGVRGEMRASAPAIPYF